MTYEELRELVEKVLFDKFNVQRNTDDFRRSLRDGWDALDDHLIGNILSYYAVPDDSCAMLSEVLRDGFMGLDRMNDMTLYKIMYFSRQEACAALDVC